MSGLRDWKIQRLSAIVLALYFVFFLRQSWHATDSFDAWLLFFERPSVKILTCMALIALLFHAWIGVWTITTDYLKSTRVRLLVQAMIVSLLGVYGVWGFMIVEGMV